MSDGNDKSVEEAAAQGPLPGAEEADEAARRGEDASEVKDPEQEADEAGDETVPGGIAMGRA
jgi:hypothetical protein